jgi:hypothetical protein
MVILRCAWHPFFRGYPRPLRVVSWRGAGIAFSDTMCRSCAERVRIEGLWASSPPTPVWPGSAHTALLFVGLPLLTALLLMAAPLHDGTPPAMRKDPARRLDPAVRDPSVADLDELRPRDRRPVAPVARRPADDPVPDVVFEIRRILRRGPERAREGARSAPSPPPRVIAAAVRRPAASARPRPIVEAADIPTRALAREPQSP